MQSKTTQQNEQNSLRPQKKAHYTLKDDGSTSASPLTQLPTRDIAIPDEKEGEPTLPTVPTNLFYILEKEEIKQNQSKNTVNSSSLWKRVGKKFLEPPTKQRRGKIHTKV